MAVVEVAPLDGPVFTGRRSRLPVSISAAVGLVILAMLIVMWVWGAIAPPHNPLATDPASQLLPPGPGHILGTDKFGRDILSRVMAGTGIDLAIAILVMIAGVGGLTAAFAREANRRRMRLRGQIEGRTDTSGPWALYCCDGHHLRGAARYLGFA